MARVLVAGVAVADFVFQVDEMPSKPEKYRANDAIVAGGGNAANAAVAIARQGGEAMLAARLGDLQQRAVRIDGYRKTHPFQQRQVGNTVSVKVA